MNSDFLKFSVGDLATILSFLFSAIGAVYFVYFRLGNIEHRLGDVDVEMKKQTEILVQLAAQRERLNALDVRAAIQDKRIDELWTRLLATK